MLRALRVLAIAAIIALSLGVGGSTASADSSTVKLRAPAPVHFNSAAITWE